MTGSLPSDPAALPADPAGADSIWWADSLWWDGRLRTGVALRITDGFAAPIEADQIRAAANEGGFAAEGLSGSARLAAPGLSGAAGQARPTAEGLSGAAGRDRPAADEMPAVRDRASSVADGIPAAVVVRRLPGTLLPGLTDAHVHTDLIDAGAVWGGGIAGVWDLGGVPDQVAGLRDRARDPGARLPRMTIAGPFLTAPGGYPSDRAWAPPGSWREIRSAGEALEAVAGCVAIGARLIKVTANAAGPMLPAKTFAAVVDAAHAEGMRVVVHAEGPGTVEAAVRNGADLLAHTPWTERQDDALLRDAADAGMTWISTLDIHGWGTDTPSLGVAIDNLRRFREHGGSVVYGTDLGNGPLIPGVNPREIRALQRAGLTPDDVLSAMTTDAADSTPCWIPAGLDLDPTHFADSIAMARVLGPEVHPRDL